MDGLGRGWDVLLFDSCFIILFVCGGIGGGWSLCGRFFFFVMSVEFFFFGRREIRRG